MGVGYNVRAGLAPADVVLVMRPVTRRESELDAAYAELFRREFAPVVRTVSFIVRDRQKAEDVAQDAFVQLLRNWPKIATYDRPDAWVRRIAIRLAIRVVRRERLWSLIKRDVSPARHLEPRDIDVLDSVQRLPAMQRAAIVLFYYEDRPLVEVARILGCAEPTARVHLHRGRKKLAELLQVTDEP